MLTLRKIHLVLILFVVAGAVVVGLSLISETRGVGSYDQKVFISSNKPLKSVSYCDVDVNDELRQLAESTADPQLFDWRICEPLGDWFNARIKFTTRSRLLFRTQIYHHRQLVILADFTDGTRSCRVVNLPDNLDRHPITVVFD